MDTVLVVGGEDPSGFAGMLDPSGEGRFLVVPVPCPDWDRDLSPWPAPPAFRRGSPFAGGAEAFLPRVIEAQQDAEAALSGEIGHRIVAGYSLAGLFALWTLYKTPLFDRAACASPSLWYPGFREFMAASPLLPGSPRVSLSLGDREEMTRNPVLAPVGEGVRAARETLLARGVPCTLRMDRGGHFENSTARTAQCVLDLYRSEGDPLPPFLEGSRYA